MVGYALKDLEVSPYNVLKPKLTTTHTMRVLPSLSTTDAVTVPWLFKLVGVAIFPKSISVFDIVVVRVLLVFLFTTRTTVSAVKVAVMYI